MTITATRDRKLLIKFQYDPVIVKALRNVPACHWEPKDHGWITNDTPIIRKMLLSELKKSGLFKDEELPTIKPIPSKTSCIRKTKTTRPYTSFSIRFPAPKSARLPLA